MSPAPAQGAQGNPASVTMAQLVWLATQAGFPDPAQAAAVAWAESLGRNVQSTVPDASGPNGREDSWGLWQVNVPAHPEYTREVLLNPFGNVKAALAISKGGTDWTPWTQFRNGKWVAYYATAKASQAVPA